MTKYRFHNSKKVLRVNSQSSFRDACVSVVVPNRSFTVQDLAYRMQQGLPMPQITSYKIYDNVGLRHVSEPTDLLSAFSMSQELEQNTNKINELKNNVSTSEIHSESVSKENK